MKRLFSLALCMLLLLAACGEPPSGACFDIDRPFGQLAADLVRAAAEETLFKASDEDLQDIYGFDPALYRSLAAYHPGPEGKSLLYLGEAFDEKDASKIEEDFTRRYEALAGERELHPSAVAQAGGYVLLCAGDNNQAAVKLFLSAVSRREPPSDSMKGDLSA